MTNIIIECSRTYKLDAEYNSNNDNNNNKSDDNDAAFPFPRSFSVNLSHLDILQTFLHFLICSSHFLQCILYLFSVFEYEDTDYL